jgi:hypothetical protein
MPFTVVRLPFLLVVSFFGDLILELTSRWMVCVVGNDNVRVELMLKCGYAQILFSLATHTLCSCVLYDELLCISTVRRPSI